MTHPPQGEIIIEGYAFALCQLIDGDDDAAPYLRYGGKLYIPHSEHLAGIRAAHEDVGARITSARMEGWAAGLRHAREVKA